MRSSVPPSLRFSMQSMPPDKANSKIGKFISAEKRNQLSQMVKKSSLTFGHSANQTLTTSQQFYSPFKGQTHTSPPSHNISQLRNKNNRTHFSIGRQNDRIKRSTTFNTNFNLNNSANDALPAGAAAAVGGSLSASHVNIGSAANTLSYISEARKEFSSKNQMIEMKKKQSTRDMVNNLSAHHYSFGADANQLRTSAELQFKPYKGYHAAQPASTNEKRTESHIVFGQNSPMPFKTTNDNQFFRKSFDISLNSAGKAKLNANMEDQKKTNFNINHANSQTSYVTTNKAHYLNNSRQSSPLNNTIDLSTMSNNSYLRQSHIQLGNAPRDYSPASRLIGPSQITSLSPQKQLPPIPEVYKNSQIKVRERLNHGTLTIGHSKLKPRYETTYQTQAKNRSILDAQPLKMGKNMSYDSHFTLNQSFPNYYSSQSKQSFASPSKFKQVNKQQYVGRLKTHHFNLGVNDSFDSQTCQKRDFQYSGNPFKLRSKIDPKLLSDLTNTHFIVGSHQPDFRTNNQSYEASQDSIKIMERVKAAGGRADGKTLGGIEQPTAKMLNRKKLNLGYKINGKGNGSTGEQDFVTVNQANFNWIQPEKQ